MENQEQIERITELTRRFLNGNLSGEEAAELEAFLASDARHREAFVMRTHPEVLDDRMGVYLRAREEWKEKYKVAAAGKDNKKRRIFTLVKWRSYAASAAVLLVLSSGSYWWFVNHKVQTLPSAAVFQDIKPGGNKAILTLANGHSLVLDSMTNGVIARQGASRIVKLSNGLLSYKATGGKTTAVDWNTVSTPAGGTYQVLLPDGSKVWLNAVSSIRFPAAFSGNSRDVTITGEVYLEVARDARRPFSVSVRDVSVAVLGTSLDIMGYDGQPVTTTLVQGSVRVDRDAEKVLLKPGEQAEAASTIQIRSDADIEAVTAWKNGLFIFNNAGIQTVMDALSRWYAVPVRYEGAPSSRRITGLLSRDDLASKNLSILEANGYHFKIIDGTIVVLP